MGATIWLTGLSGAGKSTIAEQLDKEFKKLQIPSYILDGDNIRLGLNNNLGFSATDRDENIRRIMEVSKLFADAGLVSITAFISPFEKARNLAKEIHRRSNLPFVEVYVSTSLEDCEKRDVKGLYKLARAGNIKDFTGIDSPYEPPSNPDIILNTIEKTVEECAREIINYMMERGMIGDYKIQELFVKEEEKENLISLSKDFKTIQLTKVDLEWVQVLSEGWASPLKGFMREKEYLQTLHFNSIINEGDNKNIVYNQSIPIVLPVNESLKNNMGENINVKLEYQGKTIAVMLNCEIFPHRKVERCSRQFGIYSENHPTIKLISEQSDWLIGGDLKVFERIKWNDSLDEFRKSPKELRHIYKQYNTDAVFAFQLRNPIHNGHKLLMQDTREMLINRGYKNPVLLLHPLGGWTKDDDVPLNIRIKQHQAVIEDNSLNKSWTILAIFPSPMLYAGPTEVQWHCRCRLIAGANFYIVGRDPAGLPHPEIAGQDLFDPTHGAKVLTMARSLENLEIVPFRVAAYNKKNQRMEIYDINRHDEFDFISGTRMRKMAREGIEPPNGFMSPNAWKVMVDYYSTL